ncbi:MAG: phosphodiester glycosidase family protein [Alistipes sp.]|nr:phosphodiester glycosidase family protein [Alistipes sp.]
MIRTLLGALTLLCTLPAASQTPGDSIALATAVWHTSDLGGGAECRCAQIDLFGSRQSISVVSYPPRGFETRIVHLDRRAEAMSRLGRDAGADIAVNGSYFNVRTFEPVTFVLADKKVVGRTTPQELMRTNGIVAFKGRKGRRMDIFRCDTAHYDRVTHRYRSALAAGPVLVDDGRIVEYDSDKTFYTGRHPRTLIGKRAGGEVVLVVIDGRFKGQGEGTTIAETAYIARQLGLVEALNLDGGGSSTLWTAQEGVLNHPYDNHRFDHAGERGVPNCITVTRNK